MDSAINHGNFVTAIMATFSISIFVLFNTVSFGRSVHQIRLRNLQGFSLLFLNLNFGIVLFPHGARMLEIEIIQVTHLRIFDDFVCKTLKIEAKKLIKFHLYFSSFFNIVSKLGHMIAPACIEIPAILERSEVESDNFLPILDNTERSVNLQLYLLMNLFNSFYFRQVNLVEQALNILYLLLSATCNLVEADRKGLNAFELSIFVIVFMLFHQTFKSSFGVLIKVDVLEGASL